MCMPYLKEAAAEFVIERKLCKTWMWIENKNEATSDEFPIKINGSKSRSAQINLSSLYMSKYGLITVE